MVNATDQVSEHPTVGRPLRRLGSMFASRTGLPLSAITLLSLCLNLWGNSWGLPDRWHPDEISGRATQMVLRRSLNPDYYAYGGLHFYVVAAGAVVPAGLYALLFDPPADATLESDANAEWRDTRVRHVYILSRSISAIMASGQVLIIYGIGLLFFGNPGAIFSALFLAVAPYFVVIAHFATVDAAANFWYWLSFLFLVLGWQRGNHHWYILAAITAGLAIGTKLDRGVILLPLVLGVVLNPRDSIFRRSLWSVLGLIVGYVVANPMLLLSPFDFLDQTLRWLVVNMVRTEETSYLSLIVDTVQGLGAPLFAVAALGLGWALVNFAKGRQQAEIGFLVASVLPIYLAYSSTQSSPWYAPALFPGLALFAGYGIGCLRGALSRPYRPAAIGLVVFVAGFSLVKSIMFEFQFAADARYQAARWLEQHAPQGSSIELGPRHPLLDHSKYEITQRSMDPRYHAFFQTWRENLARHEAYHSIRRLLLDLERTLAPLLGLPVRERPAEIGADRLGGDVDTAELGEDQPDYIVLVEYLERQRIEQLDAPGSGYQRVAQIQYGDPLGWNPSFPFLNSPVHIFQRTTPPVPSVAADKRPE
jgi:Dolichyl-phosphate-mannose-protein mannosyltransferase